MFIDTNVKIPRHNNVGQIWTELRKLLVLNILKGKNKAVSLLNFKSYLRAIFLLKISLQAK
jgi:hypothetical protein